MQINIFYDSLEINDILVYEILLLWKWIICNIYLGYWFKFVKLIENFSVIVFGKGGRY